jgi:hypothetical protein
MDDLRNSINLNSEIQDLRIQLAQLQGKMSKMYSEEDLRNAWEDGRKFEYDHNGGEGGEFTGAESFEEWFGQHKKK